MTTDTVRWVLLDDLDRETGEPTESFEAAREAAAARDGAGERTAVLAVGQEDGAPFEALVWTSPDGYGGGSLEWPPDRETYAERATAAGMLHHPVIGWYMPDDPLEEHANGEHDQYPDPDSCSECERGSAL